MNNKQNFEQWYNEWSIKMLNIDNSQYGLTIDVDSANDIKQFVKRVAREWNAMLDKNASKRIVDFWKQNPKRNKQLLAFKEPRVDSNGELYEEVGFIFPDPKNYTEYSRFKMGDLH